MRAILLCLLLGGCSSGYYSVDSEDTIAARLAEGAVLCHVSAWHGVPAFTVTTNTKQACREVGGVPGK